MSDFSPAWLQWRERVDLDEYEQRWDKQAQSGANVHGEADFIDSLARSLEPSRPCAVLDAGCGMGRVGIELHNRGHQVVGVDLDPDLLDRARSRGPSIEWVLADLATLDLATDGRNVERFDIIAMAGNVLPFVRAEDRARVVDQLAHHLLPEGLLIAGFALDGPAVNGRDSAPAGATEYQGWCDGAGLLPVEAWSSWDKQPLATDDGYRVFVHRK